MLSDDDIAKLCHGRIVRARVYNSAGTDATEPHFGIMLDSDNDIREHDSFFLVMISHNRDIDDIYVVPVPARTGFTGYVICSWGPNESTPLAAIVEVTSQRLTPAEMKPIMQMIRKHRMK